MNSGSEVLNSDTRSHSRMSKKKKKKSKKKRKRHSSEDSSRSSSSSGKDRRKKILAKERKRASKILKKEKKSKAKTSEGGVEVGPPVPEELIENSKRMAPLTKEEWEKRQSVIRKIYDEQTGRFRLIKGDGEVLEEIVSKERHQEINKQATIGDGNFFQSKLQQQKL